MLTMLSEVTCNDKQISFRYSKKMVLLLTVVAIWAEKLEKLAISSLRTSLIQ